MKYCIIDDEPIAHRIIEGYCNNITYLEKIGNCYDAFEAIQLMNSNSIDLIFLDINMPKLSGFDLLKTMRQTPKVIVTSAYKEFALEGYDLNISDYLLKPFSLERFLKAITKVSDQKKTNTQILQEENRASFFLKGDKRIHQIHLNDILFIEAYGNYTKVFTNKELVISHEKISSLEEILPTSQFIRVHKSFIVAINKINLLEGNRIKIKDHYVAIGQTYKNDVKRLFKS